VKFSSPQNESNTQRHFEPLRTDAQAADLPGIHPKTLQRLARLGEIPAHRIGRFWRYRASELDSWLRDCANAGAESDRPLVRV